MLIIAYFRQRKEVIIMNIMDNVLEIEEAIRNIEFAVSTLECVRISIPGNEDFVPSKEVVDDAIVSIERIFEHQTKVIDDELDKLCSKARLLKQNEQSNGTANNDPNKESKQKIIELIEEMQNEKMLRILYNFTNSFYKEEKAGRK